MADNGEVSASHPLLGALSISGRDMLLAIVLLALGVGAVAVQWITLTAFQQALARDVIKVFQEVQTAQRDREQILAVLRAKSCAEALTAPAPERPR